VCHTLDGEVCSSQYGPRIVVILRQRFNIRYAVANNTCASTIQMEGIVAFSWQQWVSERTKTNTAYLIMITFHSYANYKSIILLTFPVSLVLLFIENIQLSCFLPFLLPAATAQSAFRLLLLLNSNEHLYTHSQSTPIPRYLLLASIRIKEVN